MVKSVIDKSDKTSYNYFMLKITTTPSIRTIKPGDPDWIITNSITSSGRASIEIDPNCPGEYMWMLQKCFEHGWIRAVAHVTEKEKVLLGLSRA